ncbi:hypothetical protein GE09DRAFT_1065112 [Coniochaeta sp. 2T2.1]|nr:hypothetical protein GE09DRAFT_1065112 [Coniochaeta sp. 2T2.1]
MDTGGLAQMSHQNFAMPGSGLASRRGGQNIKPLSMDALKSPVENGIPTPRTSRGHLLAGLRTAPKTSTASSFASGLASPTSNMPGNMRGPRNSMAGAMYDQSAMYNGPKTSVPRYGVAQQQGFPQMMGYQQHFTPDQILAPPQLPMDDPIQEEMDPSYQAQLLAANQYLQDQQRQLQQQLLSLQQAAQQFQGLNLQNAQYQQQQLQQQQVFTNVYQQQARTQQPMPTAQPGIYSMYDPVTGQQTLYVDQSQQQQLSAQILNQQAQTQYANGYGNFQQQQTVATPRVQVSPPPVESNKASFRNPSPPRRFDSPVENPAPLPPPSANAFRRGHKKSNSLANNANKGGLSINTEEPVKTAPGPKTATFPMTPMTATGGYGPGQGRAGEHPIRQPRNPPSLDELKARPTTKHEGSKNFVARTRRSALHNLVRAGLERRKEARSSGSISPISEDTEEPELVETPMTDNGSDSGRSGSGSLVDVDDAECSLPSSRTSTGSWGAIGSDRPSSRQKLDRSNTDSDNESAHEAGSFASLLKNANRAAKADNSENQRKAPMLVLTSAEKRKVVA